MASQSAPDHRRSNRHLYPDYLSCGWKSPRLSPIIKDMIRELIESSEKNVKKVTSNGVKLSEMWWILDMGASNHMTGCREILIDTWEEPPLSVVLTDGALAVASLHGRVIHSPESPLPPICSSVNFWPEHHHRASPYSSPNLHSIAIEAQIHLPSTSTPLKATTTATCITIAAPSHLRHQISGASSCSFSPDSATVQPPTSPHQEPHARSLGQVAGCP